MGRALFLSFILHIVVVAIVVLFLKDSTLAPQQKSKSISLVNIVLISREGSGDENKLLKKVYFHHLTPSSSRRQTATTTTADLKKVVKKLPKKQKKRPLVKKVNNSKKVRNVHKHKPKKAKKLSHKKSSKQAKTKVVHSKSNKLSNKKRQRRTQTRKVANSSTYQKTTKTKNQADDSKIKALIYQAINRSTRVPRLARKLGILGEVYTCFRVAPGKKVSDISTSGGHPILQKEARATINRASYSFPTILKTMNLCINIKWR